MKKVLCILAIIAFVTAISTSCEKDCVCVSEQTGDPVVTYPDITKSECDEADAENSQVSCSQ